MFCVNSRGGVSLGSVLGPCGEQSGGYLIAHSHTNRLIYSCDNEMSNQLKRNDMIFHLYFHISEKKLQRDSASANSSEQRNLI